MKAEVEIDIYINNGKEGFSLHCAYSIIQIVILQWKLMGKERWMAKMIEEGLDIKMAGM